MQHVRMCLTIAGYDPVQKEAEDPSLVERAIVDTLRRQVSLGVDVVTDGEMDRRDYCSHFCHKLKAVDCGVTGKKTMRNGGW